jgi:hypothetical protein
MDGSPPVHLLNPSATSIFLQKLHVENFPPKVDVSLSSPFLVLSHFRVFLSDGSSKTRKKARYKKNVSKSFYKKPTKGLKPISFRFLYLVLGRFSVRGV